VIVAAGPRGAMPHNFPGAINAADTGVEATFDIRDLQGNAVAATGADIVRREARDAEVIVDGQTFPSSSPSPPASSSTPSSSHPPPPPGPGVAGQTIRV